MTATETIEPGAGEAEGPFVAVPPLMFPLAEWRPEYGTIDDPGRTIELGAGVYVYASPNFTFNVNSMYVVGDDGAAVIDAQLLPLHANQILAGVAAVTDQPVRYLSNSHHHPDHCLANAVFEDAGAEVVSSYLTARLMDRTVASDQLFMLSLWGPHLAERVAIPRTTFVRSRELWLGKTAVQLFEFSDSTTVAGESVDMTFTWLPQSKVLHVGDALEPGSHTFFAEGTSVPDWKIQLGHLRELVNELQPRVIVPGHGEPGDAGMIDVQERYLDTVTAMVEDHCRGGEVGLDDESRARLRAEIDGAFPGYGNPLLLDISLEMIQGLGPTAFLTGRPDATTARRLPRFR